MFINPFKRSHRHWPPWIMDSSHSPSAVLRKVLDGLFKVFGLGNCDPGTTMEARSQLESAGGLAHNIPITSSIVTPSPSAWWFQPLWKVLVKWDDYAKYIYIYTHEIKHVPVTNIPQPALAMGCRWPGTPHFLSSWLQQPWLCPPWGALPAPA